MLIPGSHISIFTALLIITAAYPEPEEDKTFNLKIGFDLTHGENGAPSLRIRDFEESREYNPRADASVDKKDDKKEKHEKHEQHETHKKHEQHGKRKHEKKLNKTDKPDTTTKPTVAKRADSSDIVTSDEESEDLSAKARERVAAEGSKKLEPSSRLRSKETESSQDGSEEQVSTRGPDARDFEPDDVKQHKDNDDDERRRSRQKRSVAKNNPLKMKRKFKLKKFRKVFSKLNTKL